MAMVNDEGVGETQGEQQQARRVVEPDLLWIESVTERLLGSASRTSSAWERVYFDERVGVEAETPASYQPPVAVPVAAAEDEHAASSEPTAPAAVIDAPADLEAVSTDSPEASDASEATDPDSVGQPASTSAPGASPDVDAQTAAEVSAAGLDEATAGANPVTDAPSPAEPATVVDLTSDVPTIVTDSTRPTTEASPELPTAASPVEAPAVAGVAAAPDVSAATVPISPIPPVSEPTSPVPYFEPRPSPVAAAESYSVEDYAVRGYVPPLRLSPQPAPVSPPAAGQTSEQVLVVAQPVVAGPAVPEYAPTAPAAAPAAPQVADPVAAVATPVAPVAPPVAQSASSVPTAEPITTLPAAPRPHRRPEPTPTQPPVTAQSPVEGDRQGAPSGSVPWDDTPAWHATAQSAAAAAAAVTVPQAPVAQSVSPPVAPPLLAPVVAPTPPAATQPDAPATLPVAAAVAAPVEATDDDADQSARHSRSKHGTTVDAGETALRLAFLSGDAKLAEAVVRLLTERSADQQRLGMVESYLDALLDEGGEALPGAARLRRLLRE